MRTGKIIMIDGGKAKIVFNDLNIQKTVSIVKGLNANIGDTGIVIFEEGTMLNGILIGVL